MKLYQISFRDYGMSNGEIGTVSFQVVRQGLNYEQAHKLAVKFMLDENGLNKDDINENDLEVYETYEIGNVDGYKIKLTKE
jgi:hypothetical protein